jgi:hypothetical protein
MSGGNSSFQNRLLQIGIISPQEQKEEMRSKVHSTNAFPSPVKDLEPTTRDHDHRTITPPAPHTDSLLTTAGPDPQDAEGPSLRTDPATDDVLLE